MKRAGAINHRSGATLTVTDSLFMNNRAVSVDGGDGATASAINSRSGSSVPVRHCTFLGNEAIAGDGGVVSDSTKLVGFGCGSAIYNNSSTLSVENSTFTNNRAVGGSGGSGEGAMTTVFYTLDVGAGGANFIEGTLLLSGSTFTGNQAIGGSNATDATPGIGQVGEAEGGVLVDLGTTALTNCRFEDKEAQEEAATPGEATSVKSAQRSAAASRSRPYRVTTLL
jgi:hypothetical protein